MIPQTYIEKLLEKADIVELIGAEIKLEKGGANYFGRCPFHQSKQEGAGERQFSVAPVKGFYHCFGCGAHGSLINFFMKYKGLKFIESIELLAAKVGLPVPDQVPQREKKNAAAATIAKTLNQVNTYYRKELKSSKNAINFLKGAGISGKTASKFQLGYAPKDWCNLKVVFGDNYLEKGSECGILVTKGNGKAYDKFRDRVMFPLFDLKGQLSGFIGRTIAAGKAPVYLRNSVHAATSPAGEIFGFTQAENEIHIKKHALVVQGCLEVLVLHEYGFGNAISTPGELKFRVKSAYIEQIFRKTNLILFCFANTEGGTLAAWQTMKEALPVIADNKMIRFVMLPDGEGASSILAQEGGVTEFRMLLKASVPLSEFLLQVLTERHNVRTIEGRAALMAEAKGLMQEIQAPHIKELLQGRIKALYQDDLELLSSVEEHDSWLGKAIDNAISELIIVSPWITRQGIERFSLCDKLANAVRRGASITIYTDAELNQERKGASSGDLMQDGSYNALIEAGAKVEFVTRLHSKMVISDSALMCVGSFNWLSAAKVGRFKRHEVSIIHRHGGIPKQRSAFIEAMALRKTEYA